MDHEFTMASLNRKLYPEIETVFLMPSDEYAYLSSSAVREIAFYGGDVSPFVTSFVEKKLKEKMEQIKRELYNKSVPVNRINFSSVVFNDFLYD